MNGPNGKRLIEVAYLLEQRSIDQLYEENVRHVLRLIAQAGDCIADFTQGHRRRSGGR